MNIEEIRGIAQTIFSYYFVAGFLMTALAAPASAIIQLVKQEKGDRKRILFSILKCIGYIIVYTIVGYIFELVLPGSSFVFIVPAGVPIMIIVIAIVICSLVIPLFAAYIIVSVTITRLSLLTYWLAHICKNKKTAVQR